MNERARIARGEPIIEVEDLVAAYGDNVVLDHVSCCIRAGEIVALLGGSGCGKSTLMRHMIGLEQPTSGRVRLLGHDLAVASESEMVALRRRVAMLFQTGALFGSMTIYDNVALAVRQHTDLPEKVVERMVAMKMRLVGLDGLQGRFPHQLSGGQRKRAALARASVLDPEMLFCDEPSAGLDPVVAAGLDVTLRRFSRTFGMTLIVVTHELPSIRLIADRVIMLADRRIVAEGTVPELERSASEPVRRFFARMARDEGDEGRSLAAVLDDGATPAAGAGA
jgi:phospholipid/cholesterol/gamma-HCH transport system ATP-binding protein